MRVVVIASQKGGAGKSTLAAHLAVQADALNPGKVALIDIDPQGSLAKWWNNRAAETPVFVSPTKPLIEALADLEAAGFLYVFIDTPPQVDDSISVTFSVATLILIPVKASPFDLMAIPDTLQLAHKANKPTLFVLNDVNLRARATGQTMMALLPAGPVSPVQIAHRVDYNACLGIGQTALEINPDSRGAQAIRELWLFIRTHIQRRESALEPSRSAAD